MSCHVHNELTAMRRVYVGVGSLVCIINLLITPVAKVLENIGLYIKHLSDLIARTDKQIRQGNNISSHLQI